MSKRLIKLSAELRDQGKKYCVACEEVHPLEDFYSRTQNGKVSYTARCKTQHNKQLKDLREAQAAGTRHKPGRQFKLF